MTLTHNLKPGTVVTTVFGEYAIAERQGDSQYVRVVDLYGGNGRVLPNEITGVVSVPADPEPSTLVTVFPRPTEALEAVLQTAADHDLSVELFYIKKNGERDWRTVQPQSFKTTSKGNRVVVAYDEDRDGVRTFKLDRIGGEVNVLTGAESQG